MAKRRTRLDEWLVEQGYFADLRTARGWIMTGKVVVDGKTTTSVGLMVGEAAQIHLRGHVLKYASRGGYKLAKALDRFGVGVASKVVLDAGASTGGFTDCLLQAGATLVYAVDVGHGQFRASLAADPRVRAMERTNISEVRIADLDPPIDMAVADLSYLTLSVALGEIRALFRDRNEFDIVALVKPLYEGLRQGDVTSLAAVEPVLRTLFERLSDQGIHVQGSCASPLLGGRGAIEFLGRFRASPGLAPDAAARAAIADAQATPPVALAQLFD
ncbi:MAG TPA: TlyA family RNA methyltransferase [Caulobacteraceae bacterium]|nr:TlyA family RNA methyltransferase [Caulobacteraceae bacterium]